MVPTRGPYDEDGLTPSMDIFGEEYFYAISYLYIFQFFKNFSICIRNYNLTWRFQKYFQKYFILRVIFNRFHDKHDDKMFYSLNENCQSQAHSTAAGSRQHTSNTTPVGWPVWRRIFFHNFGEICRLKADHFETELQVKSEQNKETFEIKLIPQKSLLNPRNQFSLTRVLRIRNE